MENSTISLQRERSLALVPQAYRDLAAWPEVDATLLLADEQKRLTKFSRGIEMRLAGYGRSAAAEAAGVSSHEFTRVFKRCLTPHPDGRIWGLRALRKGVRVVTFVRRAPLQLRADMPAAGYAGILGKTLADHPQIEPELVYELTTARKLVPTMNRLAMRGAHRIFLRLCAKHGVSETEYPFNTQHKGRRAFRVWMKSKFLPKHAAAWVRAERGASAGQSMDYQAGDGSSKPVVGCYVVWQIDEVCIDQQGRYELPNATGDWESLDLRRCSAIRLIEMGATSTLAWRLVLAAQPTAEELVMLIWDSMNGPPKVPAIVPGLDYMEGAGYPAVVFPRLRFAMPHIIEIDRALSHLAEAFQRLFAGTCGALVRVGAARTPQARAHIEAKFKLQAQRVVHQLPATTGSGPEDPVRKKSHVAVDKRVRVDELEHVLDVYIANENATPAAGAGYEAPLERLRRQLQAEAIRLNYLPVERRKAHYFNGAHGVRLKVDHKNSRRPFINFLGVRYTSPQLQRAYTLTGVQLWVRFDPRDLRVLIVFLDDGSEFGPITALGHWGKFQHDLRIRKLFLRLKRRGELGDRPEDGPLEALFAHLREGAPRDRTKALQLAQLVNHLSRPLEGVEQAQQWAEEVRDEQAALSRFDSVAIQSPADLPKLPPGHLPAANESDPPASAARRLPLRIHRG